MFESSSFGGAKFDEGGTRSTNRLGSKSMSENFFDLSGQLALVTGASRGLGQYFGRALAKAGADLVLTSRKKDDLLPFVAEIKALGRKATPLALDVRDEQSIVAMAAEAEAAVGQIHILVNNAG